jgi:uncharacterized protein YfaS (alpha-2-macroglobulin family)
MQGPRRLRWYFPWLPLGMVSAATALTVFLLLGGPQTSAPAYGATLSERHAVAYQTTDKLILAFNLPGDVDPAKAGSLLVELVGPDGKVVDSVRQDVEGRSIRVELATPKMPPEQLTLRCTLGKGKPMEVALKRILLVKAHETTVSAGKEFFAGSRTSLRVGVHGVKTLTETVPLPGSSVEVSLTGRDGKTYSLYSGAVNGDGLVQADVQVPQALPGTYKMTVLTRSALGQDTLEQDVTLKTAPKVLLTTDKPLYQPGQLIHIRALTLDGFNLTPVAGAGLALEVEDGRGNKVFKKALTTSDFGIASADFQLADEVNQGDYRIKVVLNEQTTEKVVVVKPYVLPKFKTDLATDRKFYQPKETIKAEVQSDYLFGKPVANGKVTVTASTFDVEFKKFAEKEERTDANGHLKFEVTLPDHFVGQPIAKGNALVRLEVKITDGAGHSETVSRTLPVSDRAIQVNLIPEGGRLIPGLENRVFVAAISPDGTPIVCDVDVWLGAAGEGKPTASVKTGTNGLAEFRFTPKAEQFRAGPNEQHNIEMLGGQTVQAWAPKGLLDVVCRAKDARGDSAEAKVMLSSEPFGENVLLRLDRAIYKTGDTARIDIRSSAGMPTVYIDVVRSGQTLLTRWLDVRDGKASYSLDLAPGMFGTLEIHAYQMLGSGEIIRDSRVIYVRNPDDLKIEVKADRQEYRPGQKGSISFLVTDAAGKPTQAALGIMVVDEAVYALQDMQPGLEKVYFTLQEELLRPSAQVLQYRGESINVLAVEPVLSPERQQGAEVLLTAVRPKPPARWDVNPALERRRLADQRIEQLANALWNYGLQKDDLLIFDEKTKTMRFAPDALAKSLKLLGWNLDMLSDPLGGVYTLADLERLESGFTADRLARAITQTRLQHSYGALTQVDPRAYRRWFTHPGMSVPETALADAWKRTNTPSLYQQDAWGRPMRLVKRSTPRAEWHGVAVMKWHDLVSAGPDGVFGTADDVVLESPEVWHLTYLWWLGDGARLAHQVQQNRRLRNLEGREMLLGGAKGGRGGLVPEAAQFDRARADEQKNLAEARKPEAAEQSGKAAGGPPVKVREYFPETMHWQPALITDEQGRATLPLEFADSITTWRLSASASTRGGSLGGATLPLRVFQPFFVDIDLPLALTKGDEVSFPIAVYNYLKEPQTVTLRLTANDAFELTDGHGYERSIDLKANEVAGVTFRIRANKIGSLPLEVRAMTSKQGGVDAVKRFVEVVPNGRKREQVVSDRLGGTVTQKITLPAAVDPESAKVIVKVYPGVFSQVVEGLDGMLRMPNGCFEQTSSSAYPNILIVQYMRQHKQGDPKTMLRAEEYLNAGYQRLLTFEHRKGGGFDWWGREENEPLIWLSAYGLHEFNDMSKVMPIDRGVIERTQKFLLSKQDADGTWSKIGATHGESIERMGDAKLLLTSYVTWALLDSGYKGPELKKSIAYIRDHVKDEKNTAYVLALSANALASYDAQDDSTFEALKLTLGRLEKLKEEDNKEKTAFFPIKDGQSISYARGDGLTVETTALAVLAMRKNKQFAPETINKCLLYLVKKRDASGTWGGTQATILALKALLSTSEGATHKGTVPVRILLNGEQVDKYEITEANADVLKSWSFTVGADKEHLRKDGPNEITIEAQGETALMYQIVTRHFEAWDGAQEKPAFDVKVTYDRTKLSTADLLRAKATLKFNGQQPAAMVMLDLGVPPGFTVDAGEFADMVKAGKVNKFSVTSRQIILYLGDVKPGQELTFEYVLKPKYPIKAKTPASTAYEYYTPSNRGTAAPAEIEVTGEGN